MADEETPGFTVNDRRRASQPAAADESAPQTPAGASASETAAAAAPQAADTDGEPRAAETDSSQEPSEPFLPDPSALLAMVAAPMETSRLMLALLPVFDMQAWRALGLLADPMTGETRKDLPTAQLAIDGVQFLLGKVASGMPEPERREAQRRLTDLRMNYLAKLHEG